MASFPGSLDASEGGHNSSHIMLKVILVIVSSSLHGQRVLTIKVLRFLCR
jgi:hypothetical protein